MNRVQWCWALCLALVSMSALAQASTNGLTAHDVVRDTSDRVMAVVQDAQAYAEQDPERYYAEVQAILDPVIDFRVFARGVMGAYASSDRYRALDEAGRAQLREQLDRFTEVMRVGLVRTYSKGLLAFGGSRIEVSSPAADEADLDHASVEQLIYTEGAQPYVVIYQMGRDRSGEWKLRNVIIESVNLGEIYRSQFEAAARKENGDLDAVIDSWTVIEVDEA